MHIAIVLAKPISDSVIMSLPNKKSGFTLIELLVALALIVILGSIAIPDFQNKVSRNDLSHAELTIRQALEMGYELAIANNTIASLQFTDNKIHITIGNNTVYQQTLYLPSNTEMTDASELNFLSNGIIHSGNGQLTIQSINDKQQKTLRYSIIGIITR